ncbi:DEAD/DEAH box helicase family protein [Limosilactobacillus equigenerosi]|uniref:DEAD/DEAH box helicase family protein n=1 Tax=Limosilactobacillus equigenerosi TaxID=417373 RepID=UPI000B298544|nr:DEAD/DEAH box helicase family protein [Limosilactobacillus equigenerosi]
MVIHDKDASEKQFQERFVNELKKFRWEAPEKLDGNKVSVTVQSLIDNWRNELNRLNSEELDHVPLTDSEFNQVMDKVRAISNSFEASKLLSMENGIGKIDGIYRDTNPKVTHSQVTLKIFNKPQVSGGSSSYQVAREVVTDHGNRFDIVLLINGLPLINIEQKRTDKTIKEAYGQFKRYYRDGEYQNNFMAFSQMMVVTSEIETKYFATPKSLDDFNPKFVFHWADKQNNIINYWKKIISDFLMIPMAHQMVGDYLVIESGKRPENERHMLMRPYQIHALQAIEGAALGKDEIGYPHGGFIWHTTGSGKTITSFKTALVLSTRLSYDKVVFMVDRKELDANTEESFKSYSEYESVEVAGTASTHQLRTKLLKGKSKIIVTTTYKISNLVKDLVESKDNSLSDKRIIFIVDEAQRTTMGKMMASIKDYFQKNGLFYGFTGTPLFDENNAKGLVHKIKDKQKSELINTTEKLFGPELHRYTIDEAIRDGNVLGFNVDYINTGEFKDYDELKDKLIHKLYGENATREEKKRNIQIVRFKNRGESKSRIFVWVYR